MRNIRAFKDFSAYGRAWFGTSMPRLFLWISTIIFFVAYRCDWASAIATIGSIGAELNLLSISTLFLLYWKLMDVGYWGWLLLLVYKIEYVFSWSSAAAIFFIMLLFSNRFTSVMLWWVFIWTLCLRSI